MRSAKGAGGKHVRVIAIVVKVIEMATGSVKEPGGKHVMIVETIEASS